MIPQISFKVSTRKDKLCDILHSFLVSHTTLPKVDIRMAISLGGHTFIAVECKDVTVEIDMYTLYISHSINFR